MVLNLLNGKSAVLLDMNNTFMFEADRFGEKEDYHQVYSAMGGCLPQSRVNACIKAAYDYMDERYPKQEYHECFPSVEDSLKATLAGDLHPEDMARLVETFAAHEIGTISAEYIDYLNRLSKKYIVGAVIDIWAPCKRWNSLFQNVGIDTVFSSISYSSDHGMVKPSPRPFSMVLEELGVAPSDAVFIGDSVRRDLGGSFEVGMDCILVGGCRDARALACVPSLLDVHV